MEHEVLAKLFEKQLAAAKPFTEEYFEPYEELDALAKRLIPDELVYEEYKKIRLGKKALFYMVDELGMLQAAVLKVYDVDLEELAPLVEISDKAHPDGMSLPGGALPRLRYIKE